MKLNAAQFAAILGTSPQYVTSLLDRGLPAKRSGRRGEAVEIDLGRALRWYRQNVNAPARPWGDLDEWHDEDLRDIAPLWSSVVDAVYELPTILRKRQVDAAFVDAVMQDLAAVIKAELIRGGRHPLEAQHEVDTMFSGIEWLEEDGDG